MLYTYSTDTTTAFRFNAIVLATTSCESVKTKNYRPMAQTVTPTNGHFK